MKKEVVLSEMETINSRFIDCLIDLGINIPLVYGKPIPADLLSSSEYQTGFQFFILLEPKFYIDDSQKSDFFKAADYDYLSYVESFDTIIVYRSIFNRRYHAESKDNVW